MEMIWPRRRQVRPAGARRRAVGIDDERIDRDALARKPRAGDDRAGRLVAEDERRRAARCRGRG
jgi:hypothetical protein